MNQVGLCTAPSHSAVVCKKTSHVRRAFLIYFLRNASNQSFLLTPDSAFSWISPQGSWLGSSSLLQHQWEHCLYNWLQRQHLLIHRKGSAGISHPNSCWPVCFNGIPLKVRYHTALMGELLWEWGIENKNGLKADSLEGLFHPLHPRPSLNEDTEWNNRSEDISFL